MAIADLSSLHGKRILLDCRFLGRGGAGRATELLLRGLKQLKPEGRWILWGGDPTERFLWRGATWHETRSSATALWGQRSILDLPAHDVAIYMHQIRPLRLGRSITLIHDTIPLRYGPRIARLPKLVYLRTVALLSTKILTVSDFSRSSIVRDLRVRSDKIEVVRYPVDEEMVARVLGLRERLPPAPRILYVGRFSPHKNLPRLIMGFARTRFSHEGGELRLVGGAPNEVRELERLVAQERVRNVKVEGACSEEKLEELYATSRLLVLPSEEEGFGLPAWEALCCGLPTCVSDGGALPETVKGQGVIFTATSVEAMAEALDHGVVSSHPSPKITGPPIRQFASSFVSCVEAVASSLTQ